MADLMYLESLNDAFVDLLPHRVVRSHGDKEIVAATVMMTKADGTVFHFAVGDLNSITPESVGEHLLLVMKTLTATKVFDFDAVGSDGELTRATERSCTCAPGRHNPLCWVHGG